MRRPIAIAGFGTIARSQHVPTLIDSDNFVLAGALTHHGAGLDVPTATSLSELKRRVPQLDALAICTPPIGREALIAEALDLGLHVLVEKPPAATFSEARRFVDMAVKAKTTLYLTWHVREAAGVEPFREWLSQRTIERIDIEWAEDVRVWHPGQDWIWGPGVGVFDPGINALSVLTHVLPTPVTVEESVLHVPANRSAPIRADLVLRSASVRSTITALFDFDRRGPQTWAIRATTSDGATAILSDGGARLAIDGVDMTIAASPEYARLYQRFHDLIEQQRSDTDVAPLALVADCFMLARPVVCDSFSWD